MLFGQATILISLFTAISFLYTEEDWLILDRATFIKRILIELSSISPKWYVEALIIVAFAFIVPCVFGWIVALPVKLFPVKTMPIHPEASDYAKKIYNMASEIKTLIEKSEINAAMAVMFLSSGICAIAADVILVYSELHKDGELVLDNLFGVLFGAVFFLALVGALMYGLNFVLYLLASIITRNFEKDKEALSKACMALEREWVKQDDAERKKRHREQVEAERKKHLEEMRLKEEKKKRDRLNAEAAVWAYQNNYTPDIYGSCSSSLTSDDHDDLDSLTEAMGFEIDVSDM